MSTNPLLNSFTYPATIAQIDGLKTLKAKEALARTLEKALGIHNSIKRVTQLEFTYQAYSYLLDKHYPNYSKKLPIFITETKDKVATQLLDHYIAETSRGKVIDPLHVLNVFKHTFKVFIQLYSYQMFYTFTKLLGKHKLAPTVVFALRERKHINFANTGDVTTSEPSSSKVGKDTTVGITLAEETWDFGTYNHRAALRETNKSIDFYLFLLSNRNNIPPSFNYYWDTTAAALLEDYGDELITQFKDQLKQQTRSITNYLPKLKETT